MEKSFQLIFNEHGVYYTPKGKNVSGLTWWEFEASAYKFRYKKSSDTDEADIKTVSEKIARKILGNKKVDEYLQFVEKLDLGYTIAKAEALNSVKMYQPCKTASEGLTFGYHYHLAGGRAEGRKRTYINPAEATSSFDDIFKLMEM